MAELGKSEEYTLDNPHPGFGKDEHIANEKGHTHYPKYVHLYGEGGKIASTLGIAKDNDEEVEMLEAAGTTEEKNEAIRTKKTEKKVKPEGWNK